ncbi:MAG: cell division protein ZapA, partial [Gammaproteobacteria bacterium]|nr:cell division protein ZapA [Gammaproteobacteria bacterium]
MSETQATTVDVAILGRIYRVKCATDEVGALQAAARHVDRAMREVQSAGGSLSLDRIAVMAALNIA